MLAVVVLHSLGVFAGTTTGSLTVTATVSSACSLSSGGTASFGSYDAVTANATSPLTVDTSFQLQCTNGTNPYIMLSQGNYASSGSTDALPIRNMSDGQGHLLNYQLYTTAGRTTIWDNAVGLKQPATGLMQTIKVYGSIPAGQNVPVGSYLDTVVITVSY